MAYLVDTNILLRWIQPHDVSYAPSMAAVKWLFDQGEDVYITVLIISESSVYGIRQA